MAPAIQTKQYSEDASCLPVMKDTACDAKNVTTKAASSTQQSRPRGCCTAFIAFMAAHDLPSSLANLSATATCVSQGLADVCAMVECDSVLGMHAGSKSLLLNIDVISQQVCMCMHA